MTIPEEPERGSYRTFPVLTRAEGEAEGAAVVRELPTPTGVLLCASIRDVMLWLSRGPGAFPAGSGMPRRSALIAGLTTDHPLHPHLRALVDLTEGDRRQGNMASDACLAVATWAAGEFALHTELAFTQAAALLRPRDSTLALSTARLARDLAQFPRAETWFRHAIKLARVEKDRRTFVDALRGLGTFYIHTGNIPAATAVFQRTMRGARRWKFRDLEGAAHHDLFHLAAESGELRTAYQHAGRALVLYVKALSMQQVTIAEQALVRLAGDLANFWMHLGCYRRAIPVYEAVVDRFGDVTLRAIGAADLARAAGLVGDRDRYESARRTAMELIENRVKPARVPECLALISMGDVAMGEWDRAHEAAREAVRRATSMGAAEVRFKAEEVLDQVAARRRREDRPASFEPPGLTRLADSLAVEITEALV